MCVVNTKNAGDDEQEVCYLRCFVPPGLCCSSLEEPKTLMKMGLSMVLVGHVNFMLGALVHGVVLRHINLHKQARAMEYAISNVFAITSGLVVSSRAGASRRSRKDSRLGLESVKRKGRSAPSGPDTRSACWLLTSSALFRTVCVRRESWWASWPSSCRKTRGADVWLVSLLNSHPDWARNFIPEYSPGFSPLSSLHKMKAYNIALVFL